MRELGHFWQIGKLGQVWGKYEKNGEVCWDVVGKGSVERCVGGSVGKCIWGVGEVWKVCLGRGEVWEEWESIGRCGKCGEVCGSVFGVWESVFGCGERCEKCAGVGGM